MKKYKLIFGSLLAIALFYGCSDTKEGLYDPKAISTIDKLSETIGKLKSCSYSLSTDITYSASSGKPALHKDSDVYMKGPSKMYIYTKEPGSRKGYYYNGSELALFRFDNNTYETAKAPDNTIATITAVHDKYGVDFPAADFFYPTLTDDLIHDFDTIVATKSTKIGGVDCQEINAVNAKANVFISIEKATNLPKKLEIYYLGKEKGKSYTITFIDFKTNPVLEDKLFNFIPPATAVKTELLTKKLED